MVSFNSTNCVPMSPLAASLGPQFGFLGLINFWLWLNSLVASIQLQWEICSISDVFHDVFASHLLPH